MSKRAKLIVELAQKATNEYISNVSKLMEDEILIENNNTFNRDLGGEDNSTNFNEVSAANQTILTDIMEVSYFRI